MIDYLEGSIKEVNKFYIVLEVKGLGIGLKIYHTNPFYFKLDLYYKIPTYLQIKEDEHILYGFNNSEERRFFLSLIEVNGIGPKTALTILSSDNVNYIINAINNEDINHLKRISGIGYKLAQQIILDLKNKFNSKNNQNYNFLSNLKEALLKLNFNKNEIDDVIEKVDLNEKDLNYSIKECLKLLRR